MKLIIASAYAIGGFEKWPRVCGRFLFVRCFMRQARIVVWIVALGIGLFSAMGCESSARSSSSPALARQDSGTTTMPSNEQANTDNRSIGNGAFGEPPP
jgi:hypothetical protein